MAQDVKHPALKPLSLLQPAPQLSPLQRVPEPVRVEVKKLGVLRVTAYCSCYQCCGKWSVGNTDPVIGAMGVPLICNLSCASTSDIPFGTKLLINGNTYIVQDRTASWIYDKYGTCVDIYFDVHSDAVQFGLNHYEVQIIK